MNELIKEMEEYALINDIPIMQKEGIEFFKEVIIRDSVKSILELGTAIGYSAIQLARLADDIHVVSIERDQERYELAIKNVEKAGLSDRITLILGDAFDVKVDGMFDCIFIDAAKAQYIKFFERYEGNLKTEGVIVSDNLKFHGFVDDMSKISSRNLRGLVRKIQAYNDFLKNNNHFETRFFELGDGIALSYRKK